MRIHTLRQLAKELSENMKRNKNWKITAEVLMRKKDIEIDDEIDNEIKTSITTQDKYVKFPVGNDFFYAEQAKKYYKSLEKREEFVVSVNFIIILFSLPLLKTFSGWKWMEGIHYILLFLIFFAIAILMAILVHVSINKTGRKIFRKYNPDEPKTEDELYRIIEDHPIISVLREQGFKVQECEFHYN